MRLGSWKHQLFDSQPAPIIRRLSLEQVTPPTSVAQRPFYPCRLNKAHANSLCFVQICGKTLPQPYRLLYVTFRYKKYFGRWHIATFLISVIYTYCNCLTNALTVANGRLFKATSFPLHALRNFSSKCTSIPNPSPPPTPEPVGSGVDAVHMHVINQMRTTAFGCMLLVPYTIILQQFGRFSFFPPVSPVQHRGAILSPSTLVSFIRMATYFMPL
jgi:hypothetical protein